MPQGQPDITGVLDFDTTNLQILGAGPQLTPVNIVSTTENFNVAASFQGAGFVWNWLKANPPAKPIGEPYEIRYFAESIGTGSNNVLLGIRTGNLTTANAYGPPATQLTVAAGTLLQGVYEIACLIKFPNNPGLTGYFKMADVLEVYS